MPSYTRNSGAGTPLVLVHGVGGDASNWDGVVERLLPRFRIIRPDLPGHGRSRPLTAPCTAEDLARGVMEAMDAHGVNAAAIAGFSLGGTVALAMALSAPARVQRLALIGTPIGRTPDERARALARIEVLKEKGLAEIAAGNRERWFTDEFRKRHPDVVEARVRQVVESDPASYLHAYTVFATADYADRLPELRVPTLVITGEHDLAATPRMARLARERIPGSRLKILPGLRHSLLIEAPGEVAALLADFL
jgi:(E)-2-((N-methylformamido)methylene)succinate hydrolase